MKDKKQSNTNSGKNLGTAKEDTEDFSAKKHHDNNGNSVTKKEKHSNADKPGSDGTVPGKLNNGTEHIGSKNKKAHYYSLEIDNYNYIDDDRD